MPHWADKYYNTLIKNGIKLDKQDMEVNVKWSELYAFGCKVLNLNVEPENQIIETITDTGTIYEFKNKSTVKTTYGVSPFNDGVRYIKIHPANLAIWEGPEKGMGFDSNIKQAYNIEQIDKFGMNGIFFGSDFNKIRPDGNGKTSAWAHAGIFAVENKVLCSYACHAAPWEPASKWYPQRCLVSYKDGTFDIVLATNISEITKPYFWVISGIGLYPTYNPPEEGFIGDNSGALRKTTHTSIGVTGNNMIVLARSYEFTRQETIQHMKDLGCVLIVGLDGGGSTQYRVPDDISNKAFQRPSHSSTMRLVPSMILATDLKI